MQSKLKEDKKLVSSFKDMNWNLAERLLKLYLVRCRFKHSLVFMQFRKLVPDQDVEELKEIFDARVHAQTRILTMVRMELDKKIVDENEKKDMKGYDEF